MAALLNWERWQDWTDLQNAKLLAVTDGKGNLGDSDIRTLIRFIRCSKSELYERLERLKEINLKTNDMIVFSRIDHFVPSVYRKQNRITVNAFF